MPKFLLITAAIRAAVVKSAWRNCSRIFELGIGEGEPRSMIAPLGTRPAVGWFNVELDPPPPAENPPVTTEPCAAAYTCPSAPFNGVSNSRPPCRFLASPIAAAVTSSRAPGWANGGSVAVSITAAVLLTWIAVGETETPIRCSRFAKLCAEKTDWRRSPVPASPTTSP